MEFEAERDSDLPDILPFGASMFVPVNKQTFRSFRRIMASMNYVLYNKKHLFTLVLRGLSTHRE